MNRFRGGGSGGGGAGGGGRKASRVEGIKLAGEEWNRKGSFINKPAQGWQHPDDRVMGPGVSYIVRYMGCIEVLRSMRSLDFNTRTQVTREAINRLYEAVPGVKGNWKKKAPNKALFHILGKSNLRFAGMNIAVNISIDGLNLMVPTSRQILANHHMQSISFASGGDTDTTDYVAYVAKDPINQRACHILECCDGLAQSVINTVGQAFELRFKQYLHSPPKVVVPPDRMLANDESAWGDEEESSEHDYYNSIPGKEPPLGGIMDSRIRQGALMGHVHTQPTPHSTNHFIQGGSPSRRDQNLHVGAHWDNDTLGLAAQSIDGYLQPDRRPLGSRDYDVHMYVNTQNLDGWDTETVGPRAPEDSPKKDLFDMRPFEDALKMHESIVVGSPPVGDQWPSPPTRKAPIAPTEEQLRREPWYHGKMSRREAEKLLQMDGDFLVRDSITNPGQYVLTGMHIGQPKHLLLVDPEGVVRTKDVLFESISHLINYHLQNEQPIVAAESELHLRQVVKRRP
ncbi:SHC-transforming protein 2 isoform X2 [Ambystoma mexicanum]